MTKSDGSVTMFNIFGKRMEGGVLDLGHAVYAFRGLTGKLKIMDRGGSAGKLGAVFESLEELAKKYSLSGGWDLREAAVMENVFAKFMGASAARQCLPEQGVSLEAQEAKIRVMATVQSAELLDVIVDGGESAKSLNRPGLQRLPALTNTRKVQAVIVAKLDRLTHSVRETCAGWWSYSRNARQLRPISTVRVFFSRTGILAWRERGIGSALWFLV